MQKSSAQTFSFKFSSSHIGQTIDWIQKVGSGVWTSSISMSSLVGIACHVQVLGENFLFVILATSPDSQLCYMWPVTQQKIPSPLQGRLGCSFWHF